MQILPLYPTLIYCGRIDESQEFAVQEGFKKTVDTLINSNRFHQKRPGEHQVSDTSFGSNVLQEFELIHFQQEVLTHAVRYMQMIGRDTTNNKFEISESWITLTNQNEYAPKHEHGAADISGVYYVNVGNTDGQIYFSTPVKQCQSSRMFSATHPDVSIPPANGMFILFPGWLEHGVSMQTTDGQRVSTSFNIKVSKDHNEHS